MYSGKDDCGGRTAQVFAGAVAVRRPFFVCFGGLSIGRRGLLPRSLVFAGGGIFAEFCLLSSDIRSCGVLLFGDICFSRSHASAAAFVFCSVVCRRQKHYALCPGFYFGSGVPGAAVPVYPAETEMTSAGTAGPTRITGGRRKSAWRVGCGCMGRGRLREVEIAGKSIRSRSVGVERHAVIRGCTHGSARRWAGGRAE